LTRIRREGRKSGRDTKVLGNDDNIETHKQKKEQKVEEKKKN